MRTESTSPHAPLSVFAHRGLHDAHTSENSLRAFDAAIRAGADGIELDVRRTRDGVLVVHHDARVGGAGKIAQLDASQLPLLDDGQRIPTLAQVADLARRAGVRMSVELKERGYEAQVVDELRASIDPAAVEIMSFDERSIASVRALDPSIRTGIISAVLPGFLRRTALYPAAIWIVNRLGASPGLAAAARTGAQFVSAEHRMLTREYVERARARGVQTYAWTVNDPARMAELVQQGVDGITTDRTDAAVAVRDALRLIASAA